MNPWEAISLRKGTLQKVCDSRFLGVGDREHASDRGSTHTGLGRYILESRSGSNDEKVSADRYAEAVRPCDASNHSDRGDRNKIVMIFIRFSTHFIVRINARSAEKINKMAHSL